MVAQERGSSAAGGVCWWCRKRPAPRPSTRGLQQKCVNGLLYAASIGKAALYDCRAYIASGCPATARPAGHGEGLSIQKTGFERTAAG